jgi:outer membrane protein OmpA-like peptidoglycan-associated protein
MKTLRNLGLFIAFSSAGAIIGCAPSRPPQDLVSARSAYDRASKGPAPDLNPKDMDAAKKQLDLAEASYTQEGNTEGTRNQSYLALRKTELAEVVARTRQSNHATTGVVDAMHADEKRVVALTSAELGRTKTQLGHSKTDLIAKDVALATQGAALKDEKARRQEAEKRAAQAAADLAKFATVKQEPRGMVITLSGSVLFASAKWDLLPTAQLKLNDVANALTREDPHSKMVVEGHTDSQGQAAYNQDLSQHRAQAVRDYLVSRGIASDRISAQGFGLTRSIADNKSPEGRANNRRVEIVVLPTSPAP